MMTVCSGLVPLHNACSYGHFEVTQLLIEVFDQLVDCYRHFVVCHIDLIDCFCYICSGWLPVHCNTVR